MDTSHNSSTPELEEQPHGAAVPSFGAVVVTFVRVVTVQAFYRSLAAVSPGRHGRHPLPRQSHADPRRGGTGRH